MLDIFFISVIGIVIISLIIVALITFRYFGALAGEKSGPGTYAKGRSFLLLEKYSDNEKNNQNVILQSSESAKFKNNQIRQLISFVDFQKVREEGEEVNFSQGVELVGDYDKKDEETIFFMQKNILDSFHKHLLSTRDCVVFFDDHNFRGRAFMIPIDSKERSSEYSVRNSWMTDSMTNADRFVNTNDENEANKTNKANKGMTSLQEFVRLFKFYFNQPFSCAVPKDTIVRITPFKRDHIDDKPMIIYDGLHSQLSYTLPLVHKFEILKREKKE